jgi:hypothetical protein
MNLLWFDFTFDVNGELFTATYKIKLRRWEILSTVRYTREPVVFPDDPGNATMEKARELISRL